MAECDGVELGCRRFGAHQALELIACKDSLDRSQPIRPFRVTGRCQMIEAGRMRYKKCGHGKTLVVCGAKWKCRLRQAELRQRNLADAVSAFNHLALESGGSGRKMLRKEPGDRYAGLGVASSAGRCQGFLGKQRSAGRGREQSEIWRGARQGGIVERPAK